MVRGVPGGYAVTEMPWYNPSLMPNAQPVAATAPLPPDREAADPNAEREPKEFLTSKGWKEDPDNWKLEVRAVRDANDVRSAAVEIVTRNITSHPRWLMFEHPSIEYHVELTDSDGVKIPPRPDYEKSLHAKAWAGSKRAEKVFPGKSHVDTFELAKCFVIPRSGVYSVQVKRFLSFRDLMAAKWGASGMRHLSSTAVAITITDEAVPRERALRAPRLRIRR